MKILWITNILFPEPQAKLTGDGEIKGGGGWMTASAEFLAHSEGVSLIVATVSPLVESFTEIQGKCIKYYVLPYGKGNKYYNSEYEPYFQSIQQKEKPDVVHIHGTEFTQGLAYVNACGNKNVVVSIQGMKSVIANYYCAGITLKERLQNITLRDLIKGGIGSEAKEFAKQGQNEIELIRKVKHVIGRTDWDKAHTWAYNNYVTYHHCDEILRAEFYTSRKWDYSQCKKHSIFLSQAWYPLKGAHQVLKAVATLLEKYPDLEIRIAGNDMTQYANLKGMIHYTTYAKYLTRLINRYQLKDRIKFLSPLSIEKMIDEYLNCNVFICPSSIENSPNSLGEAQVLGTPCIASFAGGIPTMMRNLEKYLFRFEDVEELAYLIDSTFAQGNGNVNNISGAVYRHDAKRNNTELLNIYEIVSKDVYSNNN